MPGSFDGQALNLAYDGVVGAEVALAATGRNTVLIVNTGPEGIFSFNRKAVEALAKGGEVTLTARHGGQEGRAVVKTASLFFEPVHYRPLPQQTAGLKNNCLLLDGVWRINPAIADDARSRPLTASGWSPLNVPGQWLQQGFDIPKEKPVAVATEFVLPKGWAGNRMVLRFDAIHAGTRYWLNGHELGRSENLFTPVEWDITTAALPGQTNRLDLEMKLDTVSEALSVSSAYAFHNLGGIDRSVRVFALPPVHVRELHVNAGLDAGNRDGELQLHLALDSGSVSASNLTLKIGLRAPDGKPVTHSTPTLAIPPFTGRQAVDIVTRIARPLQWNAEKPFLYRLALELCRDGAVLERIERNIGFRKIEVRGSQLFVNGQRVKLAGLCHHEFDPLTGRANTARHAETDVRLLKAANLNYIRTSHYPPPAELLDAADRLGMYVEVEAPFCWVGGALDNATNLAATLTPTSAMVDYHHSHPSVLVWSLANESHFNRQFLASARMCKDLDPTRPTTFNHDMASSPLARVTDIANCHYPPWPYDAVFADDPRPLFFGEYFFPICHEQTDVRINPGLRELWGHGQAEPESEFAKACGREYAKPPLKPGLPPGGWSAMFHSDRVLGGAIWASHDDAFYFSETNHAGYAWHHGFWGLIDAWRRPKPEWELARHIFSPVWLAARRVDLAPGQKTVRVPVENRYAFTDFSELDFRWQIGGKQGRLRPALLPGERGELEIPVPKGTTAGDSILLRANASTGAPLHESLIQLGMPKPVKLAEPVSGSPTWSDDGNKLVLQAAGFGLVLNRATGTFDTADPRHTAAVTSFPMPHVTRYDFGDLTGTNAPPYAVFPDAATRRVEKVEVVPEASGLRLTVHEKYDGFAGSTSWLLDRDGRGVIACDYIYSGPPLDTREAGIRLTMRAACDELRWRRWSEWGVFSDESLCRAQGSARAHRDKKLGEARWNQRPSWPWALDETELGTSDFRSAKYNIYEAALVSRNGSGLGVQANADAHVRAALAPEGVNAHLLWRCPLGQVCLLPGDRLQGAFVVRLGKPLTASR